MKYDIFLKSYLICYCESQHNGEKKQQWHLIKPITKNMKKNRTNLIRRKKIQLTYFLKKNIAIPKFSILPNHKQVWSRDSQRRI